MALNPCAKGLMPDACPELAEASLRQVKTGPTAASKVLASQQIASLKLQIKRFQGHRQIMI